MLFQTDYLKKTGFLKIVIIVLSVAFFILEVIYNQHVREYQHFSLLANSFLQGKLYFTQAYSSWWHDAVSFGGQYYWPQGFLPAVILMPFVYLFNRLHLFFYQSYLQVFINFGVYFLIYKIAKKFDYSRTDSLFFAFAFSFASTYIGVSFWPTGWFFAQVVSTFFLFLALKEYLTKRRLLLTGILFGLTFLTRITASFGLIFVFWEIFTDRKLNVKQKMKDLLMILIPMAFCFILFLLYNYLRFGNLFEQGYGIQSIAGNLSENKYYGLFSLIHIPGNIYYFLLAGPVPVFREVSSHILTYPYLAADPWGLGIIFTSPYLLYMLFLSYKDKFSIGLILTILITAFTIFSYYGIGWFQFGYRYSLDFLPLIFILFMRNFRLKHKELSLGIKLIIILSALFNYQLFSSLFKI